MSSTATDREPSQNQFLTRVSEIPLVKAFLQIATSTYETTKHSNALIEVTLEKVEGIAKLANTQAEPLKILLDRPLSTVSKIADRQLEELQHRFPVINSSPHDILEYGHNLYERSGVKNRVDDISHAKNMSVDKITGTTVQVRNRLVGSVHSGQVILNHCITGALDYTENVVDKYLAAPDSKKRSTEPAKYGGSYFERVRNLSGKVVGGVGYRTMATYNLAKRVTVQTYTLIDRVFTTAATATITSIQKILADTAQIREAAVHGLADKSREIAEKSDSAAVYLTKAVTHGVASISDRMISTTIPFLPEGLEKPAASVVSYVFHLEERVEEANSVGDIWKTTTDETKKNLRAVQGLVQSILNNNDAQMADNKRW